MPDSGCVVVVGGTSGLGHEVARHYADLGWDTVLTGRHPGRAAKVAAELGPSTRGIGLDLTRPADIVGALPWLVSSRLERLTQGSGRGGIGLGVIAGDRCPSSRRPRRVTLDRHP